MNCRYYTEMTLGWMLNNKMIVFLGLLSFCLFVSTLAMAGQRNRYKAEVEDLKSSTTTNLPTDQTDVPTTDVPTTDAPTTDVPTSDVPTSAVPPSTNAVEVTEEDSTTVVTESPDTNPEGEAEGESDNVATNTKIDASIIENNIESDDVIAADDQANASDILDINSKSVIARTQKDQDAEEAVLALEPSHFNIRDSQLLQILGAHA